MSKPIAILCSDIHLCHTPPPARSVEDDWYEAMKRVADELKQLEQELGDVPIICAGDVFDRWNSPPELINWAIKNWPTMWSIPGQHDLPYHNPSEVHKSAYWTLVEAGVISQLDPEGVELSSDLLAFGYGWNTIIDPIDDDEHEVNLLVAHRYIWTAGHSYPGAPPEARAVSIKGLQGYHAAVFGDNHKGFLARVRGCNVLNNGCIIRRKADEKKYKPSVGILDINGGIERHYLDTSQDKWLATDDTEIEMINTEESLVDFIAELGELSADSLDFREAVRTYLKNNDTGQVCRELLMEVLDD